MAVGLCQGFMLLGLLMGAVLYPHARRARDADQIEFQHSAGERAKAFGNQVSLGPPKIAVIPDSQRLHDPSEYPKDAYVFTESELSAITGGVWDAVHRGPGKTVVAATQPYSDSTGGHLDVIDVVTVVDVQFVLAEVTFTTLKDDPTGNAPYGCSKDAGDWTFMSCVRFWRMVAVMRERDNKAFNGDPFVGKTSSELREFISGKFLEPHSYLYELWAQYVAPVLLFFMSASATMA